LGITVEAQSIFISALRPRPERRNIYRKKNCAGPQTLLERAITKWGLSARAYDRILKVGRTIADLAGREQIAERHISEAAQYRTLDHNFWT
jgi:magnesium chelatase family protein